MNGDPTLDMLTTWLKTGANLDNIGAVAAIGALLRFFIVPMVEAIIGKICGVQFFSVWKLQLVNGCGVGATLLIGVLTQTHTALSQQILIGMLAAATAVGIHQATEQSKKAMLAVGEQNKMAEALSILPMKMARFEGVANKPVEYEQPAQPEVHISSADLAEDPLAGKTLAEAGFPVKTVPPVPSPLIEAEEVPPTGEQVD
jgi:hypothetical protein